MLFHWFLCHLHVPTVAFHFPYPQLVSTVLCHMQRALALLAVVQHPALSQAVPCGSCSCTAGRRPLIAQVFSPAYATCSYDSYFLQIGDNYYTRATGKTPLQSWSRRGVGFLWLSAFISSATEYQMVAGSQHQGHSCSHTGWKDPTKGSLENQSLAQPEELLHSQEAQKNQCLLKSCTPLITLQNTSSDGQVRDLTHERKWKREGHNCGPPSPQEHSSSSEIWMPEPAWGCRGQQWLQEVKEPFCHQQSMETRWGHLQERKFWFLGVIKNCKKEGWQEYAVLVCIACVLRGKEMRTEHCKSTALLIT